MVKKIKRWFEKIIFFYIIVKILFLTQFSMLNILKTFAEAKNSNLVALIKNKFDFETYNFLNLDKNILSKIDKLFEEQKNVVFRVFLWREDFEEVIFIFYLDIKKDIHLFLWENISKLPEKITFEYEKNNVLLDSIVLWKYDYAEFKSEKKELEINIVCSENKIQDLTERLSTIKNITDARDIVNMPACDKTPDKYVQFIKNLKFKNAKIKVLDYEEIKRQWLNLLEAVWRASSYKPRLVILEKIIDKKLPTIWFVWKWIIFDTWGLNIKVEDYMMNMKDDMAWSAAVLFMMKELDEKDLNCNVVIALPIAENSVSWDAYRPSDIIRSYSWKTVEITNTDAEWRLVLADAVSYISKNYNLESITTVATLTWACMVALGYNYAGIMWNNRQFIDKLLENETFESYWELPLDDFMAEKTKWKISDLINYTSWVHMWSSMWWAFLKQFCLNDEKFTHIDIAWTSFAKEKYWLYNVWATWFWVDSLSKLVLEYGKIS